MKRLGLWLLGITLAAPLLGAMSPPANAAEEKTKTVVIGCTASQTGVFHVESLRQINGLQLWLEQVNAAGGIKLADGTVAKFAVKFYDDESKEERVRELYSTLINEDNIVDPL